MWLNGINVKLVKKTSLNKIKLKVGNQKCNATRQKKFNKNCLHSKMHFRFSGSDKCHLKKGSSPGLRCNLSLK